MPAVTSCAQKICLVCFGLILSIIILELGLRSGGLILSQLQRYRNYAAIQRGGEYRILCIGESTTFGGTDSYPCQLGEILNQRHAGLSFTVINQGVPAITTSGILARLEKNLEVYKPHMVVAMIGINDRGLHMPQPIAHPSAMQAFISSLKVYNFIQLFRLHIEKKLFQIPQAYAAGQDANQHIIHGYAAIDLGDFNAAKREFRQALTIDPHSSVAYVGLGRVYRHLSNHRFSINAYKTAIALDSHNYLAYEGLAWDYVLLNDYDASLKAFLAVLREAPDLAGSYMNLAWFYGAHGKPAEAKQLLEKAFAINPLVDALYGQLAVVGLQMGDRDAVEHWCAKATQRQIQELADSPVFSNYRKIKNILDKQGIQLVCVQYPVRSAQSLRRIFKYEHDVVIVDNEKIFKQALQKENYNKYFIDLFGGDFGHCTREGNRLLAKNIADTIQKEYFEKIKIPLGGSRI